MADAYDYPDIPLHIRDTCYTLGKQLKEARELCKLKLFQAAKMLELDSAMLKKIESGLDCDEYLDILTPAFILEAAKLYDITTDFLFGLADDEFDREPEAIYMRRAKAQIIRYQLTQICYVHRLVNRYDKRTNEAAGAIDEMLDAVADIEATFQRFRELNPNFDAMRGGAGLFSAIEKAKTKVQAANLKLVRGHVFFEEWLNKKRGKCAEDMAERLVDRILGMAEDVSTN